MKTNKLILCSVLAGLITTTASTGYAESQPSAPSANSAITWTAGGKQSNNVDVLFVQNAKNVTLNKGKLVLRGVNPVTVCFTDRPARLAGHMPTSKFVPLWSQGKDSFLKDNPNATLSVFQGDKVSDLVVELSNPQLSGNDLSYDVKVLEGTLLAKGGSLRAVHRYHWHAANALFFRWCRATGLPPCLLLANWPSKSCSGGCAARIVRPFIQAA